MSRAVEAVAKVAYLRAATSPNPDWEKLNPNYQAYWLKHARELVDVYVTVDMEETFKDAGAVLLRAMDEAARQEQPE